MALVWHDERGGRWEEVPGRVIQEPTGAIIRVTASGVCGLDLHLYEPLEPFMSAGDILGHEPMGIVEAVGSDLAGVSVGDRVVVPFQISCGSCFMCDQGLQTQCETTRSEEHTSELQSLMRISYAVFRLKKKKNTQVLH